MKKLFSVRTIILAGSLLLQLNTFCLHSRGAAGDVDLSFDPGSGVNGPVNVVAVQPDGKVIIGGQFTTVKGLARVNVARLNADGSGDSSFTLGFPQWDPVNNPVYSLALQPDGKVLVGSWDNSGLIRVNSDGSSDTNFNANASLALNLYGSVPTRLIVVQPDGKVLFPAGEYLLRLNANGTLDNSFTNEKVVYTYSMALQSDGKAIISGYLYGDDGGYNYGLLRLNANGSFDSSFDTAAWRDQLFSSIVVQPDGKVLIGGGFIRVNGTNVGVIARLNANGSFDNSFTITATNGGVSSLALQADGKVLIGGSFNVNGTNHTSVARLNANGSLDGSFNPGTGANNKVNTLVLQSGGKVLIGGEFTMVNGANRNRVARLNADGSLDVAFQPGQGVDPISSLVVQPDGKVLIGGALTFINGTNRYASARLNADGSRDETFITATNFNPNLLAVRRYDDCLGVGYGCYLSAWASTVAVLADGKVLIGGSVQTEVSGDEVHLYFYRPILGRFYADGSRDTNFAPVFGDPAWNDYDHFQGVGKVIVQPDGKIMVGGEFSSVNGTNRYGLARLNTSGTLDLSFAPATGANARISSVAVQPDGKVLIAGFFGNINGVNPRGVARLNANGSFDNSFNSTITVTNGDPFYPPVQSLALQPDGKVLIGGSFTNGTNFTSIARLNANGSLDGSFYPGSVAPSSVSAIALQSNGNVLISGGFLTVNGVLRPSIARLYGDSITLSPSLNIARSNAFVIVSWPTTGLNFNLQQSTNLSLSNSWSAVAQLAATNAGQISVTVPTTVGRKFFRLKSQ